MRHLKRQAKLGRTASHRKAMLANMAASLIKFERIQTTDAKAKALRPFVERLVSMGKDDSVHARRLVFSRLRDREATQKVFEALGPRMQGRPGGYTRIVKLSRRKGDNAPMSLIELIDSDLDASLALKGASDEEIAAAHYNPNAYAESAAPAADDAPAAGDAEADPDADKDA
jgi:large subunit ribosomal protein L17